MKAGMELELIAKLKPFALFYNDGGRDRQKQMYFKRLFAKGYVINIDKKLGIKSAPFIRQLREYCLRRVQGLSMTKESQGLVESLTLGVRHNLSDTWREVFRATGTGHLIAISGLHVGLFAYAAYKFFFFLWCLSARLCERVPAQRAAALAAVMLAFFYVALTDFSVSALRAFIMIALVMVAQIIGRRPYLWDIFFTALALVLLINPYSIYNYGFYLSFYAVFIIFSFAGEGEIKLLRLQCIISVLMLPISLYFFSYASLTSIPANLVAIPVVSFGILPVAIFVFLAALTNFPAVGKLCWLFSQLNHTLLTYLTWLKGLRFLTIPFVVSRFTQFMMLTSLLWAILKSPRRGLLFFLLPLLMPLCFYSPMLQAGQLKFSTLDIGQGLSVILQTRHHTLVYDTGMRYPSGFSLARIVTLPFLHYHGITKLDSIVISHEDNDHVGGLETLLENYPVAEVITNDRKQTNHCHQHRAWSWDGVHFSFIKLPEIDSSDNNNSCILKIRVGNKSILLTGDIERKAELFGKV